MDFLKLTEGLDISGLLNQLAAAPELWNQNRQRKDRENSPHREMDDIWLRFCPKDQEAFFSLPHFPVWWEAASTLPAAKELCHYIMSGVQATALGGVLITRISPGRKVYEHSDLGVWHAEFYNTKVYICLEGNPDCINWTHSERVCMAPGEAWLFNNLVPHGVDNRGASDRISLIISTRTEK